MIDPPVPFSLLFDLGASPDRGAEIALAPSEAERQAISHWLGTEAVESFKANIQISREGNDRYAYLASFEADVVQACVVTLEPVPAHLSGEFRRSFRVLPRKAARRRKEPAPAEIDLSATDEDEPELLEGPIVDVAAPVLEELSLALDPYPRAPGAAFEAPPAEAIPSESPFAVLEKLKAVPGNRSQSGKPKAEPNLKTKSTGKERR